jgi:SAM-dependent methyltransferase
MDPMVDYYSRRAPWYEEIFRRTDPHRQEELAEIGAALRRLFAGRRVLEVACGTGYWTQVLAEVAERVCATDASPAMLALARAKKLPPARVEFREADAFALDTVGGDCNGGLANFWLSHVPAARREGFLDGFHRRLARGSPVFLADNVFVPGISSALVHQPGCPDTFNRRKLPDGSEHEVVKNYFDEAAFRHLLAPRSTDLAVHFGNVFWWVSYRTP